MSLNSAVHGLGDADRMMRTEIDLVGNSLAGCQWARYQFKVIRLKTWIHKKNNHFQKRAIVILVQRVAV